MRLNMYTLLVLALAIAALAKWNSEKFNKRRRGLIKARDVLTKHEQPMYFRLCEALPEHVVLCQVAFSAMLNTRSRVTRNRFSQKVADFVICGKSFDVVAVIELDDSSHQGRESNDMERDALLREAGYNVLRYKTVPDAEKIQKDVNSLISAT